MKVESTRVKSVGAKVPTFTKGEVLKRPGVYSTSSSLVNARFVTMTNGGGDYVTLYINHDIVAPISRGCWGDAIFCEMTDETLTITVKT